MGSMVMPSVADRAGRFAADAAEPASANIATMTVDATPKRKFLKVCCNG